MAGVVDGVKADRAIDVLDSPWELLSKSLRINRARTAIVCDGVAITYAALEERSARLAAWLISRTVPGERIALFLGNSAEYVVADLAVHRAGLVKVPLNPLLSKDDIVHIVRTARASHLLIMRGLHGELDAIGEEVRAAGAIVVDCTSGMPAGEGASVRAVHADAPVSMPFSGGTTGRPKGVVHTARGTATSYIAHVIEGEIGDSERLLLTSPLSHSAGLFLLGALVKGACVYIESKFAVADFARRIVDEEITWVLVVPTMLYRVLDHLEASGQRLPSLRTVVYGAAPVTPDRLRQGLGLIGPVFIQLYGQTEVPNWGTTLSKSDHLRASREEHLLQSCGRASTMADVRVVSEAGDEVDAGEVGEICLRAPYQMAGYWDNPAATQEALVDGWVHTRDVGLVDAEGYVYIKDRLTDMIITGGFNVYSSEVEAVLQAMAEVSHVAIVGVPDPDWGERVHAVVVLREGATLDEAQFFERCRSLLTAYKRPKSVTFAQEIPLTPLGKADKKAMRLAYATP